MFRVSLYAVTTCFVLAAPVFAQWEQLGNGGGGQIRIITSDPDNPTRLYIGSDVAGLWRTRTNDQSGDYDAFSTDPQYEYLTNSN